MPKPATQPYELTFILGEQVNQEESQKKTTEIKDLIEKLGGTTTKEEAWGRRELAYPIKRNRSGVYTTLWFDLPTGMVRNLEQQLKFDEVVIRSLVTKAYTDAQPGSLYPATEEEQQTTPKPGKEEKTSAEEMLRRSSTKPTAKKAEAEATEDALPEEERLKKLDETLEELLKDEA